jgi:RHS repeat-associated protein
MGIVGAPFEILDAGMAALTSPLAALVPGMPAAFLTVPHLGTPHAHSHPPSLVPPAPPVPLPSIGTTMGAGSVTVLVGGMPAARASDLGIAPTCGSFSPAYEIWTGSSNVFIGGSRAARMGMDMTRHCNPASLMGKLGKVMGAAAVGAQALGAGAQAAGGQAGAAAAMAAQAAADAAALALAALMGKDPGIPPSMGALMLGNPTVLVGGLPLPDALEIISGVAGMLKSLRRMRQARRARLRSQNADCDRPGHPIDPVTGVSANEFTDIQIRTPVPFSWQRYYNSGWCDQDSPLGYGFRHGFQCELQLLRTRAIYVNGRGQEYEIPRSDNGRYEGVFAGYELIERDSLRFVLIHDTEGLLGFKRNHPTDSKARLVGIVKDGVNYGLTYDEGDRLIAITQRFTINHDTQAIRTSFGYDAQGHLVEIRRGIVGQEAGVVARYAYSDQGCLTNFRDALGGESSYAYDAYRRMTRETDPNSYTFFYKYDGQGRCVASIGQDKLWRVSLKYEPGRTLVKEADGGVWTFMYNDAGTVTRVLDPYGGAADRITDDEGRVVQEIDSGGRVMRWLYDAKGHHTGRADRWGNIWPTKSAAPKLPNPLAHKVPNTPLGLEWGELWDGIPVAPRPHLPAKVTDLVARLTTKGRLVSREPSVEYDELGRVIERKDSAGEIERFAYDTAGNVIRYEDQDGKVFRYTTSSWNLRGSEADPLGNTVRYGYTLREKIAKVIDANDNLSAYSYDHKDRICAVKRHGVVRETYSYDTGDRLIEKRDGSGNLLLTLEVGDNGLHSKRILSSGEVHSYEYDAHGNFTKASTDKYKIDLAHGLNGRRTLDKRDGLGVEHKYSGSQLTETVYFNRFSVKYTQSDEGALVIEPPVGGANRLQRIQAGVFLKELGNQARELSLFDTAGRCEGRINGQRQQWQSLRWSQYEYSPVGELQRTTDSIDGVTQYVYDDAHRLIGEQQGQTTKRRFEYDPAGNLRFSPSSYWLQYAEGNRLSRGTGVSFQYDDRNHLAEEASDDGTRTTYSYNSMDMLVEVAWSDRSECWTAEYDGLCRRISKSHGDDRTEFYWDGDRLAAEISSSGQLRLYVYPNEEAFVPFMFIDYESLEADPGTGRPYYVFHNQVGLPLRIEDAEGNTVWRAEEIDPYGMVVSTTESQLRYCLRFPGHYHDEETGLHYNRFRYYKPHLGRYLQSDPGGQSGGINLYAYPANPLLHTDVLGLAHSNRADADSAEAEGNTAFGPNLENPSNRARLASMSETELQDFCRQRVEELTADMSDRQQRHVTLAVTVAERYGDPSTRRVIVTSSTDDGSLPPGVGPLRDNEEVGTGGPEIRRRVARDENGDTIREPMLDEDGNPVLDPETNEPRTRPVMQDYEVDPDTGEAQPYTRRSRTEPEGESRHHAEQRAQDSLESDEDVAAMSPSRPCCAGCQDALGDNLERVHPDMQGDM